MKHTTESARDGGGNCDPRTSTVIDVSGPTIYFLTARVLLGTG